MMWLELLKATRMVAWAACHPGNRAMWLATLQCQSCYDVVASVQEYLMIVCVLSQHLKKKERSLLTQKHT